MFYKRISTVSIISLLFLSLTSFTQAQSWSELFPTGSIPPVRDGHTAIYDTTNNRMTIFGGYKNLGEEYDLNDVWVLSNSNGLDSTTSAWTQLFPTGSVPSTRDGHTAVYDAANNRMTIFGGYDEYRGGGYLNDVWVLSNTNGLDSTTSAWTEIFPIGSVPTTRVFHSAVYDSTNNRMIVFGGYYYNLNNLQLNDVWVLSNTNGLDSTTSCWTQLFPTGGSGVNCVKVEK